MCSSTVVGTGDMVVLMAVVSLADQLADLPGEDQAGSRYCYQYDTVAQWWGEGSMYSSTVGTSAGVSHHAAGGAGVFKHDIIVVYCIGWRRTEHVLPDVISLDLSIKSQGVPHQHVGAHDAAGDESSGIRLVRAKFGRWVFSMVVESPCLLYIQVMGDP